MKIDVRNTGIWLLLFFFIVTGLKQNSFILYNPVVIRVANKSIDVHELTKYTKLVEVPKEAEGSVEAQEYIWVRACEMATENTLIQLECEKLGIIVSDTKVVEYIKNDPKFKSYGSFSKKIFIQELSRLKLSEMEYKSIVKSFLLKRQFLFFIQKSYILPEKLFNSIESAYRQERIGKYCEIVYKNVNIPNLNNSNLYTFYKTNGVLFMRPSKKHYVIISIDRKFLDKYKHYLSGNKMDLLIDKEGVVCRKLEDFLQDNPQHQGKITALISEQDLKLNQYSYAFAISNMVGILKVYKIDKAYIPDFNEVKSEVEFEFRKKYVQQAQNSLQKTAKWIPIKATINEVLSNDKQGDSKGVIQEWLFRIGLKNVKKIQLEDRIIYVQLDAIREDAPINKEDIREKVEAEIFNEVYIAYMKNLEKKYKIVRNL